MCSTENEVGEVAGGQIVQDLVGPGKDHGFILVEPLEG